MDFVEEIKRLKSLLDEGAITQEEFSHLKLNLINGQSDTHLKSGNSSISDKPVIKSVASGLWRVIGIIAISTIVVFGIVKFGVFKQTFVKVVQKENISKSNRTSAGNEIIYEDGQKLGVLIIKKYTHTLDNNGFALNIPSGKMWTPLYYEVENCSDYVFPTIFVQRNTSTGWARSSSYYFPQKKDFISYKVSQRNTKALAGEKAIMFTSFASCKSVFYTFYFLEE